MLSSLSFLLTISGTFSLQSPPTAKTNSHTNTASSNRRQWLISASGIATVLTTTSSPATAQPSFVSNLQGPIQDVIAPGHWIGQFVGINSKQDTWSFPDRTPEQVSKAIVEVLEGLTPERRDKLYMPEFIIQTADARKVHVLTWTKLEWLDTLDVTLQGGGGNSGGCVATARFYATGFLPTSIPLAPLFNIAVAWLPFGSPGPRGEMLQDFRLRALKGLVAKKLDEK